MNCTRCAHPQADHATGVCLHTLECLCKGFSPLVEDDGPVHAVEPCPRVALDPQEEA